ncbi:hypothetical protein BKA62DRAFT_361638 [Auriculariales sp. MPI-PUGE-AT-0066]|nr:hypothetical protein BKA62DRAFT_361638 [Auriculariales sp. MPI-PUGE-AT-0066]
MSQMLLLKVIPAATPTFAGRSNALQQTTVPSRHNPRSHYLTDYTNAPGPVVISCSEFVPLAFVEHLMRNKKDSALGVKFSSYEGSRDQITNMEGALHTFVIPLAPMLMHGDYIWRSGHNIISFPEVGGVQQARLVVLSALIQQDFERGLVMAQVAGLRKEPTEGVPLPTNFEIISVADKHDETLRQKYDESLRLHMVYHLVSSNKLPSFASVAETAITDAQARALLERLAAGDFPEGVTDVRSGVKDVFVLERRAGILSLEILFMTALHHLRNELSALEHVCAGSGYVYSYDPPRIFAQMLEGPEIINRCLAAALRALADSGASFSNMRGFAFGDFADRNIVSVLRKALSAFKDIPVIPKNDLFPGPEYTYKPPSPSMAGALLVLHNNSDGFGQNIETEGPGGSLDGQIGSFSSAAASLHRKHPHLVDHIV